MELTEKVVQKREYEKEVYGPLQDDPINLDEVFDTFVETVQKHYAGYEQKKKYFTPSEYHTYVFSHFRYQSLTVEMLIRSLHQMICDLHDRHMNFICDDWIDYRNLAMKYRVRAYQDVLYVTEADPDTGLTAGDRILEVQHMTPERIRRYTRHNCFYSNIPERELWGGYLRMAQDVLVRHANGNKELINLKLYPLSDYPVDVERTYPVYFEKKDDQTAYLRAERMDRDAMETILREHRGDLESCRKLIVDLRRNIGGDSDAMDGLLPYMVSGNTRLSRLVNDEGNYVLCTQRNCAIRVQQLEESLGALPEDSSEERALIEEEIRFYRENSGKGFVFRAPEAITEEEDQIIVPAERGPEMVILLTDTFCEDEGEAFVAMCRRAGSKVRIIGRPTMGTLDYDDCITICEHGHMYLSYPISMTAAAWEGRGISEKGLPVDEYIAWTPEEITRDVILEKALQY